MMVYEGIELDLLLLDIYMLTLFDIVARQPFVAMMMTFLAQKGIDYLRFYVGVKKIGFKSLIGERFFM